MTDIVERLRGYGKDGEAAEAADEIARLRAALEEIAGCTLLHCPECEQAARAALTPEK